MGEGEIDDVDDFIHFTTAFPRGHHTLLLMLRKDVTTRGVCTARSEMIFGPDGPT